MATKQFWFVWNPAGRAPTYRHPSLVSAKTEADRLAALNPGQEFVVLQSVGTVRTQRTVWEEHEGGSVFGCSNSDTCVSSNY